MGRPEVPNALVAAREKRARRAAKRLAAVAAEAERDLAHLDPWTAAQESVSRQLAALDALDAEEAAGRPTATGPHPDPEPAWNPDSEPEPEPEWTWDPEVHPEPPHGLGTIREQLPVDLPLLRDGELAPTPPDPRLMSLAEAERTVRQAITAALDGTLLVPGAPVQQTFDDDEQPNGTVARVALAQGSTGVGKTHVTIEAVARSNKRVVHSVPRHALAAEMSDKYASLGVQAQRQYPRSSDRCQPGYCPRTALEPDLLGQMGNKNRWAAALACAKCPFGSEAMATIAENSGDQKKAAEIRAGARRTFGDDADCEACTWQLHMAALRAARVAIVTHAAFSPGLMDGRDLLIVDEAPKLVRHITVSGHDMAEWADLGEHSPERLRRMAASKESKASGLRKAKKRELADDLDAEAGDLRTVADKIEANLLPGLEAMWDATRANMTLTDTMPADQAVRESITNLVGITTWLQDNAAAWEHGNAAWGTETELPLRALADLQWAAKHEGALTVTSEGLRAVVPTTLGSELLEGSTRCLVTSATPPAELVAAADIHVRAVVDQGVDLTMFPRRSWGKAGLHDPAAARRFGRDAAAWRHAMANETGSTPWMVTHLAAEDEAESDMHHGDVEGRNDFQGAPGLLLGLHRMSPDAEAVAHADARVFALAAGADPADWPQWTGERLPWGEYVEVAPGVQVLSPTRLPADPAHRRWLAGIQAAGLVQEAGRSRGARHLAATGQRLPCWFAGSPVPLAEFGIRVVAVREDPPELSHRTRRQANQATADDVDRRARLALAACRHAGITPGPRPIRRMCEQLGIKRIHPTTWGKLVAAGILDLGTEAEIEAEMKALLAAAAADARTKSGTAPEPLAVRSALERIVAAALKADEATGDMGGAHTAAAWIFAVVLGLASVDDWLSPAVQADAPSG